MADRSAYFREYYKATGQPRDECPDCGASKLKASKRCSPCAVAARGPRLLCCIYCGTEMKIVIWHGQKFHRCGGCGLEAAA